MNKKRLSRSVTDPVTKKRVYFHGYSVKEINQKMLMWRQAYNNRTKFKIVADKWYAETEPTLELTTIDGYRRGYQRAVDYFGMVEVSDITPQSVQTYLREIASAGYAKKTVMSYKSILKLIMKSAWMQGMIQYNPVTDVPLPKGLPQKKRSSATSEDEEKILADKGNTWLLPYFALLTGLRKGELLALTWEDIDFERKVISVNKSCGHSSGKPYLKKPKTDTGVRLVPLLNRLEEVILPLRSSGLIFKYKDGMYNDRGFRDRYSAYQETVGISCTLHQLRHSFATMLAESDVNVKTAQRIMGHSQFSTTMDIYTDVRENSVREAKKKLDQK